MSGGNFNLLLLCVAGYMYYLCMKYEHCDVLDYGVFLHASILSIKAEGMVDVELAVAIKIT